MSPLVIRAIKRSKLHTNVRLKLQREKRYSLLFFFLFFFSFLQRRGDRTGRN